MATISLTVRNSGFEVAPAGMFINAWVLLVCLGFLLLLAAAIAHICRDPLLDPIVAHIKGTLVTSPAAIFVRLANRLFTKRKHRFSIPT